MVIPRIELGEMGIPRIELGTFRSLSEHPTTGLNPLSSLYVAKKIQIDDRIGCGPPLLAISSTPLQ
ncbi:unnamed protein product [Prunus armeniaca]|uniref:Uncharacterized protein n=1 Tax=Prunus armeniaca TaxID=36596 RepID=A0A6J5TED7_PRUAR|nr:unnamed protein product [Prunus armeniaca]